VSGATSPHGRALPRSHVDYLRALLRPRTRCKTESHDLQSRTLRRSCSTTHNPEPVLPPPLSQLPFLMAAPKTRHTRHKMWTRGCLVRAAAKKGFQSTVLNCTCGRNGE
jgi:hypothetical protein